ncbi:H-NS histone family protein [Comamonas terrigena]|uniref:H-NS histone family protein n=1 Tax=Comamonas terrigena TaxID=32013 RepID=UPI0028A5FB71|nr:H-NS histone family protein [Comamonas terrigena]
MAKELTLAELQKQIAELQAKEQEIIQAEKATVVEEIKAKISQYKLTFEDLGFEPVVIVKSTEEEPKKNSNKGKSQAPKVPLYRNKDNHAETWHAGKGASPKWIENLADKHLSDKKVANDKGNMIVPRPILTDWLDANGYKIEVKEEVKEEVK